MLGGAIFLCPPLPLMVATISWPRWKPVCWQKWSIEGNWVTGSAEVWLHNDWCQPCLWISVFFQVSLVGGVLILAGKIMLMIDESEENIQGQPPEAKALWWLRWLRWVPSWILPNAWQRHSTSSFHSNEQRSESPLRNCVFSSHELRVNRELVVFWSTIFTDFHHV